MKSIQLLVIPDDGLKQVKGIEKIIGGNTPPKAGKPVKIDNKGMKHGADGRYRK